MMYYWYFCCCFLSSIVNQATLPILLSHSCCRYLHRLIHSKMTNTQSIHHLAFPHRPLHILLPFLVDTFHEYSTNLNPVHFLLLVCSVKTNRCSLLCSHSFPNIYSDMQ